MEGPMQEEMMELALIAESFARLRSSAPNPELLEPDGDEIVPSQHRLTHYLFAQGYAVSQPHVNPDGVRIRLTQRSNPEREYVLQGRSLRHSLLLAIEWALSCNALQPQGGDS